MPSISIILIAQILISFLFGPLSCIILWKRYGYIGDGIIHSCLFGAALQMLTGIDLNIALLIVSLIFSLALKALSSPHEDNNILVNLLANTMVSAALIIMGNDHHHDHDHHMHEILFGDLNLLNTQDVVSLLIVGMISTSLVWYKINEIILTSLNEDIAKVQKIKVKRLSIILMILITATIVITVKLIGTLLLSGMLILPALIAKNFSTNPKDMVKNSIMVALALNLFGLMIAIWLHTPISATILIIGFIVFLCAKSLQKI